MIHSDHDGGKGCHPHNIECMNNTQPYFCMLSQALSTGHGLPYRNHAL